MRLPSLARRKVILSVTAHHQFYPSVFHSHCLSCRLCSLMTHSHLAVSAVQSLTFVFRSIDVRGAWSSPAPLPNRHVHIPSQRFGFVAQEIDSWTCIWRIRDSISLARFGGQPTTHLFMHNASSLAFRMAFASFNSVSNCSSHSSTRDCKSRTVACNEPEDLGLLSSLLLPRPMMRSSMARRSEAISFSNDSVISRSRSKQPCNHSYRACSSP